MLLAAQPLVAIAKKEDIVFGGIITEVKSKFTKTGGADQRQSLTGFDVEADVVQDLVVVVRVFEADILEPDGTGAGLRGRASPSSTG